MMVVAQMARDFGLGNLSPSEATGRLATMRATRVRLLESLAFFSSIISVFDPKSPSTAATATFAAAIKFAASIPPETDAFLHFNKEGLANVLDEGRTRLESLMAKERTLRRTFAALREQKWPPIDQLCDAVQSARASGIARIVNAIAGRRRRTKKLMRSLGITMGLSTFESDLQTLITHLRACDQFLADAQLSDAASPYWSGFDTPLTELTTVLKLRAQFDSQYRELGDLHKTVKAHLFSQNRKFVEALRSYNARAEKYLTEKDTWPESISNIPLTQAQILIDGRIECLAGLIELINRHGLSDVQVSFDRIALDAQRRDKVQVLEGQIASNAVLSSVDEQFWLTDSGFRALRQTAELLRTIVGSIPRPHRRIPAGVPPCGSVPSGMVRTCQTPYKSTRGGH
jgi:hypothetical protein